MPSHSPANPVFKLPLPSLRIGYLALTDAAPLLVAREQGHFNRHGLAVELRREVGWATMREKLIYGELDAVQAPAPMLWSLELGLGCTACEVLTAFVFNLQGNALTLSQPLWTAGVRDGTTLRGHLRSGRRREPLTLGVVFPFSSDHLHLREWLRAAGIDPDRDVRIVMVPPAQMFRHLAGGTIDGYYAGEPWNSVAVQAGTGWCPVTSAVQHPGHVEKVLIVTRRYAEARSSEHAAIVAALAEACAWCDEPPNRESLAGLLGRPEYLDVPEAALTPGLLDHFNCGQGRVDDAPFVIFHRGDANVPAVAKALVLQRAFGAAGLIPAAAVNDAGLPGRLFREDLHRFSLQTSRPSQALALSDACDHRKAG